MKYIVIAAAILFPSASWADQYVRPHVRNDGTYVEGHYRSAPNSTRYDNYSTQGNTNPYTGQRGNESPTPGPRYETPAIQPYSGPYDTGSSQSRRSRSGG